MAAAFQDIINSMLQPEEDPEIMFTDEADALPSSDPATKMHIIDLEHFNGNLDYGDPGTLNLWDCVATLLFHISPDTLSKFLDPDTTVFRLQIEPKSAHQSTLVIWKHGKDMMVSLREHRLQLHQLIGFPGR